MTTTKPTTPADHIAHAKDTLTGGANPAYAIAHALIAIAETLQSTTPARAYTLGPLEAKAAAEAVAKSRKLIP